jgi:hypothetical protein
VRYGALFIVQISYYAKLARIRNLIQEYRYRADYSLSEYVEQPMHLLIEYP